ncbi:hypothetical protein ACFLQ4_01935 [Bacteroidota bacterium]
MMSFSYDLQQEPIVLSKPLIDKLLGMKNYPELLALYIFYYHTAKWQKTNQPKATIKYVSQGIGWGRDKVRKYKQELKKLGLIDDITRRDKNNKITHWFIKVNFIWTKDAILDHLTHPTELTNGGGLPGVVNSDINAFSSNRLNALSNNKDIVEIFNCWNKQEIIVHKKLTSTRISKINSTLKDYKVPEIKNAIRIYSQIVKSDEYFFDYKWDLEKFLQRGIKRFLDESTAKNNFRRKRYGNNSKNFGEKSNINKQPPKDSEFKYIRS